MQDRIRLSGVETPGGLEAEEQKITQINEAYERMIELQREAGLEITRPVEYGVGVVGPSEEDVLKNLGLEEESMIKAKAGIESVSDSVDNLAWHTAGAGEEISRSIMQEGFATIADQIHVADNVWGRFADRVMRDLARIAAEKAIAAAFGGGEGSGGGGGGDGGDVLKTGVSMAASAVTS